MLHLCSPHTRTHIAQSQHKTLYSLLKLSIEEFAEEFSTAGVALLTTADMCLLICEDTYVVRSKYDATTGN